MTNPLNMGLAPVAIDESPAALAERLVYGGAPPAGSPRAAALQGVVRAARDPYEATAALAAALQQAAHDAHRARHAASRDEQSAFLRARVAEYQRAGVAVGPGVLGLEMICHFDARVPPGPPLPSFVYFAAVDGHIKVGWSTDVAQRMKGLREGKTKSVRLLAFAPGTRADERRMHTALSAHHYRREYFVDAPVVRTVAAWVRAHHGLPNADEVGALVKIGGAS